MIAEIIIAVLALVSTIAIAYAHVCRQDAKDAEHRAEIYRRQCIVYASRLVRKEAQIQHAAARRLAQIEAELKKRKREAERSEQRLYGTLFRN